MDSPLSVPSRRPKAGGALRPLKRKPKTLTSDPTVFEPGHAAGGGSVLQARSSRRPDRATTASGSFNPEITDDPASLVAAIPLSTDLDTIALNRARHIAARLAIARPRNDVARRRGIGELTRVRYTGNSDDIDLEVTLERIAGKVSPDEDDIVVRERSSIRRAVVLAVDVSGSMRGERIRTAAATVGALAGALRSDDLAVIAFWSDAAVLSSFGRPLSSSTLVETLIRVPARGLTNVSFPLQLAGQQLAQVPLRDRRVLLLSDCVHNAGPDPRIAAGRLARLDVLLDTSGEHDLDLARDLARVGRGRLGQARTFREVPATLARLLA